MTVQDSSQIEPTEVEDIVATDAATALDDDVEAHGAKEWIAGLSTAVVLGGAGAGVAAASSSSMAPDLRGTAHRAVDVVFDAPEKIGSVVDRLGSGTTAATSPRVEPDAQVIDPLETLESDVRNTVSSVSADVSKLVRGIIDGQGDVATRTHLAAVMPRSFAGQAVTLTATVTADEVRTHRMTGQVTFIDGGRRLGTARLSDKGIASFTTSDLRVGDHDLRAVYHGDGMYDGSVSDRVDQDVVKASTQTVVRSSTVKAPSYAPVEFTAQVASAHPGAIAPTGSVTFWYNDVRLGTAKVRPDGTATISTSELGTGAYEIVAQYTGDARHAASESLPLPQLVVDPSGSL